MNRHEMIERVGKNFLTSNVETGEYSYVVDAGSKVALENAVGHNISHFKLDIRFQDEDVVVLIETKQNFTSDDEDQLREYLEEERALHPGEKIICILANTNDDRICVWKSDIDDEHLLSSENILDNMAHYKSLFELNRENNREKVLKNTYALNETLHKKDIDEKLRSQFVGTTLLYIKDVLKKQGVSSIDDLSRKKLKDYWNGLTAAQIRSGIEETLTKLLDGSDNKLLKIDLLQRNVLNDQKVKNLKTEDWSQILDEIVNNIYKYINTNSSEGQDILNLFFIAFNKYTGKADKNQAFTPDHITNFMCRVTGVDRNKRVFDGTCGSGSFLVQAMVLELADVDRARIPSDEKKEQKEVVKREHIFGVEIEEKAFGLSTTNMLIHGDGNSNITKANLFESKDFFEKADPDIILMNPPYNAKPINIPKEYKKGWKKDSKEDPTKGMVFLKFISDMVKRLNEKRMKDGTSPKEVKIAILLPVSTAIGTSKQISNMKNELLKDNTLEAVFTLPNEVFYPGASASVCCMVFTLGRPHINADGTVNKTFFGYYKDDGHKKKKNLGRVEQFDENNNSIWRRTEEKWLDLFRNKVVRDGISAMHEVSGDDEWLCEAYMKTDYSELCEADFQQTLNDYLSYMVKSGKYPHLVYKKSTAPAFDISKWKEFRLGQLFKIRRGDRIVHDEDYFDFRDNNYKYPVITTTMANNGVDGFYDQTNCDGNCIVSGGEASGMFTTYQEDSFWGLDTVRIYEPIGFKINKHIGIFLATELTYNMYRFSYGRKAKPDNMYTLDIKLPADPDGEPDWKFMEDYIKSLPYGDRLNG